MPWRETCTMDQKIRLIGAWLSGHYGKSELARRFGVSRKTVHKWLDRYAALGEAGLSESSSAPHHHPNATSEEVVRWILSVKHRYPTWGPAKIRDYLRFNESRRSWPAASTIGSILHRHGLVKERKRRRRGVLSSGPLRHCMLPNDVWSADFKGHFRMGDSRWCYPLTVSDNASRYLLECRGLYHPTEAGVWKPFERIFREYGLPCAIRTDNGSPFASTALGGLTRLSVWFIKLGIHPERITPGSPQENGRHERMHRTLKAEAPPQGNLSAQQRVFNRFRMEYNEERPHESLKGVPPRAIYRPSRRPYPNRIREVEYDGDCLVRHVRTNGEIKWKGEFIYVSEALRGEPVGLKQVEEYRWQLYFGHYPLGMLDEIGYTIERADK